MVRDTGVRVHAAVVATADLALRVVIGVAVILRVRHVAKAGLLARGEVDVLADPPVGADALPGGADAVRRGRLRGEELGARAEDVGERLVQRPGLVLVDEVRRAVGDPVGELVRRDVEPAAELAEDRAVAVAVDDVGPVPEGVVVVLRIVDDRLHGRVAAIADPVEAEGGLEVVVRDVRVELGVHHGRLAGRLPVRRHARPVVVGVGDPVDGRVLVAVVEGDLAVVLRDQVPVGTARAVAGRAVEGRQVVGGRRIVRPVHVLRVALDPGAVVVGDRVVLPDHAAVRGVDPVDDAEREAPRLDLIEVPAALRIDAQLDRTGALPADILRRHLTRRGRRDLDGVARHDAVVVGADHEPRLAAAVPVDRDLAAKHLRASLSEDLLVALLRELREPDPADELDVLGEGEAGRLGPAKADARLRWSRERNRSASEDEGEGREDKGAGQTAPHTAPGEHE